MKRVALAASLVTACAFAGMTAAALAAPRVASAPAQTAPPPATVLAIGVSIGGIDVGGLTPEAAAAAVQTGFAEPLTIVFGTTRVGVYPDEVGAIANVEQAIERARTATPGTAVPLTVTIRREQLQAYVSKLAKRFNRPAVDAKLFLRRLRPWIAKERPGRALDRRDAERGITTALMTHIRLPVELRAKPLRPTVTRKRFGPVLVIRRRSNRLLLYRGMRYQRTFGVATGQSRYPTPLGRFRIVVKWKNPWWYPPDSPWAEDEKPVPPGPDNPLGTRWMGLSAPGVGIHGTPNPGSIGYSVSHGCVRMRISQAEWLFEHVRVGTTVFIVAA